MSVFSVSRTEKKYLLTPTAASALRKDFEGLLNRDSFSGDGAYRVKSLYFDSISQRNFIEKFDGVYSRRKIRLRIYDEESSAIKLEEKIKQGYCQLKSSISLERECAVRLANGDYSVLHQYDQPKALELYTIMVLGVYRPVSIVEYERLAFVGAGFNTRITIDSDLRASELDLRLFSRNNNWTFRMNNTVILEVKYDGQLAKEIADIIGKYKLACLSVSKYVIGRPIFKDIIYI